MAINPPTDIVLDVVNAADPSRLEAAQAKLKAGQAALQAQRLASTSDSFDASIARNHLRDDTKVAEHRKDVPESYRKFESMVLSNFLKTMMPNSDEIYGKGATGEIWKGMMAEKLADEISRGGGIGIADSLAEHGATRTRDKVAKADDNRSSRLHMATQLIDEKQMNVLDGLIPGAEPLKKKT
jgi:Rod binding domain-containing protein